MVKTKEKAIRIQSRRAAEGKRGLSPAVKRYLKREKLSASSLTK